MLAISTIEAAIITPSTSRASFGEAMSRRDAGSSEIQARRLNFAATSSGIRDVKVATKTAALSKSQVLAQAGVSESVQADKLPQLAFALLS
ncbi:MAG: hypothetical protein HRU17_20190 [Polyangiaceae bacterium]|nr:hypothetical protein [Polyangiaceae bacterium]